MDVKEAVAASFTWNQFLSSMEHKGYAIKQDRKYLAVKAPGMERFVRLKAWGRITRKNHSVYGLSSRKDRKGPSRKREPSEKEKLHGLQALYYSYLYQMGVLKGNQNRYRIRCVRIFEGLMSG